MSSIDLIQPVQASELRQRPLSARMQLVHTEEVDQAVEHPCDTAPVPSLFRLTLLSTTKQREAMRNEIPAQRHGRRSGDRHQKFELYYDTASQAELPAELPVGV